jgi:hypothetical protein
MASALSLKEFHVKVTDRAVGRNLPQRIGRVLWLPMLVMAVMAFPVGVILAGVRAEAIASGGSATTIAALGQFVPAANFLGFAAVFAGISFAIARILGELRVGGGEVQEAAGRRVETLETPWTATVFVAGMAIAMMVLVATVVLHVVAGAAIAGGSGSALARSGQWEIWLEAVRRFGIGLYLTSIAFGLATIITVLRFQSIRIRELPDEPTIR